MPPLGGVKFSAVDLTADFLNSAQLPPFVRVTGNDGFHTKSLLTKRLHPLFVGVRQFVPPKRKCKKNLNIGAHLETFLYAIVP